MIRMYARINEQFPSKKKALNEALCFNKMVLITNNGRPPCYKTLGYYGKITQYDKDHATADLCKALRLDHEDVTVEFQQLHDIEYRYYNIYYQQVEEIKPIKIGFDFERSHLIINGLRYKVIECNDFVYKVQKTQIKSKNGLQGLARHIVDACNCTSVFNASLNTVLNGIIEKVKPTK